MAYWGMAMANFSNATRGKGFAAEATKRREKASEREQLWIDGLAAYFDEKKGDLKKRLREYVRSIEGIALKYPDDIEAKAFLMKQVYYNHAKGHPIPSHYAINQLLEAILTADPDHPVHHYRIHLWDREKPEQALASAAKCGPAAPGIAHMWHMPGHIYSRLHRYADASWQQEASARIDHEHMIRFRLIPDQISNFAHNNEWLIRNLNYLGRVSDAVDLSLNMTELPRRAKFSGEKYNPSGSSWQYGRLRLRDTLFRFERWITLIAMAEQTDYLRPDPTVIKDLEWNRFLAIAKFETGDREGAGKHLAAIEKSLAEEKKKRDDAVAKAEKKARDEKKKDKDIENAKKAAEKNFTKGITDREKQTQRSPDLRSGDCIAARHQNREGVGSEAEESGEGTARPALSPDRRHRKGVGTGGAGGGGECESGQTARDPGRVALRGRKNKEAKEAFEKLRLVAADADADLPIFSRLKPIAESLGFPGDGWQLTREKPDDLGDRPDLASLGPFRWHPPAAPDWALPDSKGAVTSLADFQKKGSPVLVIFYLGKGCTHCMEQLNNFAPLTEKYAEAGIPIVAISTDSPAGLAETFFYSAGGEGEEKNAKNPFPFPLLSDEKLNTFKAYRAYDDFEKMALHGTFLIDARGRIRWQDISYEPFMRTEWLLEECKRLLSFQDS